MVDKGCGPDRLILPFNPTLLANGGCLSMGKLRADHEKDHPPILHCVSQSADASLPCRFGLATSNHECLAPLRHRLRLGRISLHAFSASESDQSREAASSVIHGDLDLIVDRTVTSEAQCHSVFTYLARDSSDPHVPMVRWGGQAASDRSCGKVRQGVPAIVAGTEGALSLSSPVPESRRHPHTRPVSCVPMLQKER